MNFTDVDITTQFELYISAHAGSKPDGRGPRLLWTAVVLSAITMVVVALRLYVRVRILKSAGWDDYFASAALYFALCFASCCALGVIRGCAGEHTWMIMEHGGVDRLQKLAMLSYIGQVLYHISVGFSKASVLIFFLRMEPVYSMRQVVIIVLALSSLYTLCAVFVSIFQCYPIQAQWEAAAVVVSPMRNDKCINRFAYSYAVPAINMLFNVVLFSMPLPFVWGLQLPWRQRLALCFACLLGMLTCIASVMTVIQLGQVIQSFDSMYAMVNVNLWFMIEAHVFIICTSLPILKPLFNRFLRGKQVPTPAPTPDAHHSRSPRKQSFALEDIETLAASDEVREYDVRHECYSATRPLSLESLSTNENRSSLVVPEPAARAKGKNCIFGVRPKSMSEGNSYSALGSNSSLAIDNMERRPTK